MFTRIVTLVSLVVSYFVINCLPAKAQYEILLRDASSLVRVGMNPHPTDENDTIVAYTLLSAIDHEDPDSIRFVRDIYQHKADNDLMKEKSWGALAYILNRMLQERDGKAPGRSDILTEDLYHNFTAEGCKELKNYLVLKYELNNYHPRSVKEYITQRTYYDDLLMFNDTWHMGQDRAGDGLHADKKRRQGGRYGLRIRL